MTARQIAGAAALAIAIAACDAKQISVTDIPSTVIEEVRRFGATDGSAAELQGVGSIAVGDDGSVYVLDHIEHKIKIFDHTGRYVSSFGREGDGPGELESPAFMGVNGDTLWVVNRTGDIAAFSTSGQLRRSWTIGVTANGLMSRPMPEAILPDERSIVVARPFWRFPEPGVMRTVPVLLISADGGHADTVFSYETGSDIFSVSVPTGGAWNIRNPFNHHPIVAVSPSGSVFGVLRHPITERGAQPPVTVSLYSTDGSPIKTLQFALDAIPVTEGIRRELVEELGADLQEFFPSANAANAAMNESMPHGDFFPRIDEMHIGADSSVWLHARTDRHSWRWMVVDGRSGKARWLPEGLLGRIVRVERDAVWVVKRSGDDGIGQLVHYRIVDG